MPLRSGVPPGPRGARYSCPASGTTPITTTAPADTVASLRRTFLIGVISNRYRMAAAGLACNDRARFGTKERRLGRVSAQADAASPLRTLTSRKLGTHTSHARRIVPSSEEDNP